MSFADSFFFFFALCVSNDIFLPQCDLVLDAAHRKSTEPSTGPRKEDIVESIIFKASDVVVVNFKDVDLNFARKGSVVIFWQRFFLVIETGDVIMRILNCIHTMYYPSQSSLS